ncbi:hypothetical protein ABK040_005561 [Willaertia magna]
MKDFAEKCLLVLLLFCTLFHSALCIQGDFTLEHHQNEYLSIFRSFLTGFGLICLITASIFLVLVKIGGSDDEEDEDSLFVLLNKNVNIKNQTMLAIYLIYGIALLFMLFAWLLSFILFIILVICIGLLSRTIYRIVMFVRQKKINESIY